MLLYNLRAFPGIFNHGSQSGSLSFLDPGETGKHRAAVEAHQPSFGL